MSKIPFDAIRIGYVEELARLWNLTEWDKIDEMNLDYFWEYATRARQSAEEDGEEDEDKLEEISSNAEQAIRDEMFKAWSDAVVITSEKLLEKADLSLEKSERGNYYIFPNNSWRDSLKQLIEIINGIGHFHFGSVVEMLESGPYGLREAVAAHYTYLKRYHEVYGSSSPERIFEQNFRDV